MPKQTYFNLPEQKRQIIEQAALDEFSVHGFDASNMNRIVEQSRIAKGSFYQYFADKKDLYFHLINELFKKKMAYIDPVLKNLSQFSLSQNLERLLWQGLRFSESDAKLHRLGEDFASMQRPFANEFMAKYRPDAIDVYLALLNSAQENGELRGDMDVSLTAFFISSLITQSTILLLNQCDTGQRDMAIHQLLSFIEHAIIKK